MTEISRRSFLQFAAMGAAAATLGIAGAPKAHAQLGPILGTVIDFSAGVPSASSIKAAGHLGAVRYVSQPRPDAQWMAGKPVRLAETTANAALGLATASVYQYGRANTADWLKGAAGAVVHAPQAIAIHKAAGGPTGVPIYVAIDDNPTRAQYTGQIRPYLQSFKTSLEAAGLKLGVYGNYNVIEWATQDGLGEYFWMHDWGSGGKIHPRTTIHQLPQSQQRVIDGITVDINNVYAKDWGQWLPGAPAKDQSLVDITETSPASPTATNPTITAEQLNALSSLLPEGAIPFPVPSQQELDLITTLIKLSS